MLFILEILYPANVMHFFRPLMLELERRGPEFLVLSRDKDVTLPLLDAMGTEHGCTTGQGQTMR